MKLGPTVVLVLLLRTVATLLALLIVGVRPTYAVNVVPDPVPAIKVPCDVVDMAEKALIARVGPEFFDRCVRFHILELNDDRRLIDKVTRSQIKRDPATQTIQYRYGARPLVWYHVVWYLELDVTRHVVSIDIDPQGQVLNDPKTIRISDCVGQPSECVFLIGKTDAIAMALEVGLLDEDCYVAAHFGWSDEHFTFAWTCQQHREPGEPVGAIPTVVIDANSGDVLFAGRR